MKKNYTPGSVGFTEGFLMGGRGGSGPFMLVDEEKAKEIIREQLAKGRNIESADLGLDGDWRENSTTIYDGNEFSPYDSYEGSGWATPILLIYYTDDASETHECWKPETERPIKKTK